MHIERSVLISFLGNYVTNNVVAALVALIPATAATGLFTPQYIVYVLLAAATVALFAWWFLRGVSRERALKAGIMFGVIGFVVSILTAFVTGISGVLAQTGSFGQVVGILPNFVPFLASWSTLVLLAYWVVPAAAVGYFLQPKAAPVQTM